VVDVEAFTRLGASLALRSSTMAMAVGIAALRAADPAARSLHAWHRVLTFVALAAWASFGILAIAGYFSKRPVFQLRISD
jgi:uncharacterized membrane protein